MRRNMVLNCIGFNEGSLSSTRRAYEWKQRSSCSSVVIDPSAVTRLRSASFSSLSARVPSLRPISLRDGRRLPRVRPVDPDTSVDIEAPAVDVVDSARELPPTVSTSCAPMSSSSKSSPASAPSSSLSGARLTPSISCTSFSSSSVEAAVAAISASNAAASAASRAFSSSTRRASSTLSRSRRRRASSTSGPQYLIDWAVSIASSSEGAIS
mmetsp:Transcript_21825/g.31778  ORF Transcript_21825/g.31778 Transcript_21825/m.31778 type:complete len:211 (-) Transcript_21825:2278-2910(-)